MRTLVLSLLVLGVFSASMASPRVVHLKLIKPNITYAEFKADRDNCIAASMSGKWMTAVPPGNGMFYTTFDGRKFNRCMEVKGYSYDPNGFDTGKLLVLKA